MPLNILVICDNESFGRFLCELLSDKGHSARCCPHRESYRKLRRQTPDAVIADIDGAAAAPVTVQKIQAVFAARKIPAIVISDAFFLEEEFLDVFDFIPKPLDHRRLLDDLSALAQQPEGPPPLPPMTDREYGLFAEHLLSLTGLHFELRNRSSLERGLVKRMSALRMGAFPEYLQYLRRHGEDRHELQKLLRFLTIGETHFFRFPAQFQALREDLVRNRDRKELRFWSAGCSTGEEAYSLAIAVTEALPDWRDRDIKIYATDINNYFIRRARDGVYSSWSLRNTERRYLDRYFERIGDSYLVREEIKGLVQFSHLNLAGLDYREQLGGALQELDAIFCRNVMIYFTRSQAERMVECFAKSLRPKGQLFLGHAETLLHTSPSFECAREEGCFYYRRVAPALPPPPLPSPEKPSRGAGVEQLERARHLYDSEEFREALQILDELIRKEPANGPALVLKGFILAGKGNLEEALDLCSRALVANDLSAEAYFLKGVLLDAAEKLEEAAHEYRKATFLDHDFVMPRFFRARVCLRLGRKSEAVRELRNGIRMLEKADDETTVPYSGGMTRTVFMVQLQTALAKIA